MIPFIRVACGVLVDAQGAVLLAQRPPGRIAAGRWEFPGGKIEAGETAAAALARELLEEIGIVVERATPLLRFRHEYHDRHVELDAYRVDDYAGTASPQEGQMLEWVPPGDAARYDLLPTVAPILAALRLPAHYVFTPPRLELSALLETMNRLPPGCAVRLRAPTLDDTRYADAAPAFIARCGALGLEAMLDRDPALCVRLGAAGWHATGSAAAILERRPLPAALRVCVSVHDAAGLARAAVLQADCAVLGAVLPTATHAGAAALGWEAAEGLIRHARLPVYALGGLGPADVGKARAAGAVGVAGISAYWP